MSCSQHHCSCNILIYWDLLGANTGPLVLHRTNLIGSAPFTQSPYLCTHQVLPPLAILIFTRNLLALTHLSPAHPPSWVNPHTGLWPQETHRPPLVTRTHLTLQGGQCVLITVQDDGLLGSSCRPPWPFPLRAVQTLHVELEVPITVEPTEGTE